MGLPTTIDRDESADPVGRYLRKIGCFRLLSPGDEIEIAKQIEFHETEILRIIVLSPVFVDYLVKLGSQIEKRKASARRLLMHIHRKGPPVSVKDKTAFFLETIRQLKKILSIEGISCDKEMNSGLAPFKMPNREGKPHRQGARMFSELKIWRFELHNPHFSDIFLTH